jgi:hypothetical protein
LDWLSRHQGDYTYTLIERDTETGCNSPILNACNDDHLIEGSPDFLGDDYTYGYGDDLRQAIDVCIKKDENDAQ